MGWRFVQQPNGMFARWSDVVDNFTDYDMTEGDAFTLCHDVGVPAVVAQHKLNMAKSSPARFENSLETISIVHGQEEADKVRAMLSGSIPAKH